MKILELKNLKKQFLPLENRTLFPNDDGSLENEVASKLYGHWENRPSQITVPARDMIGFVLYFICECTTQEWEK